MIKKTFIFLLTAFCVFCSKNVVHATTIKELTSKEFYKLQQWNISDATTSNLKFQIYITSLSILFFLFLITTIFYFKKKTKQLSIPTFFIGITIFALVVISIFQYNQVTPKSDKVAQTIVKEINNKTYLEQRYLFKKFNDNDYGFTLNYITTNSKIFKKNKTYTLSFETTLNLPFNLFGDIKRYYKYDFVYKPNSKTQLNIVKSNESIKSTKFIKTTNIKVSQFNTYCFDIKQLDKYNNGNDLGIIGQNKNNYSHYNLEYVELYSTNTLKTYCGKIRYNEKPLIGINDNKTITLMEVK